ncbi:error-prone DNA polymerase [Acidicapsa dinghuensis]|uniref:DNA-directed DNA polymerase n=1 Tax=Acidicapsa dinghuensis TaxID=2218256 RepID=A0ABW1ECJ0_9BACT|nr:error-prone DNA polymerase [Acidicapsa dinghuensis]
MTDPGYVELHAASAFSFLAGASQPENLIERAGHLSMPSIAIADRNGLYGAARFHTASQRVGVKAHIGAEVAVSSFAHRLTPPSWLPHQHTREPSRITLLCESKLGYQNLCQLLTKIKMRETKKAEGSATIDDLEEYASGLICLTGGEEGPLASLLAQDEPSDADDAARRLQAIYGRGNVYLELQRHYLRAEERRNQALLAMAASLGLPVVATNGVRYAVPHDRQLLDVFTAIKHHTTLDRAGRLLAANASRYLRPVHEMTVLFRDVPEAISNTHVVSERLDFTLSDLGYQFPAYPVPDGETMDSFLAKRVEEGVRNRYGSPPDKHLLAKAHAQVQRELKLIAQLGFAGYFLIVWDVVEFCKRNGILIQGRGSAANSAVCYALEITAVDPVGMELLFERFLSESRGEWPDIDLDTPSGDEREKVIQYLYERYGPNGAGMTANVVCYRDRMAAREVGKALGFDEQTTARLSKTVGNYEWRGADDELSKYFERAGLDLSHKRIACYHDLCVRMLDLPRYLGQHSGGMVICAGMLNQIVPIEKASMPGRAVVQWDKEDCADLGIIKVDVLGLGMMAVLKDCLELVPRHYGKPIDLAALPQDDLVYQTLRKADTVGMFQVESRAQMASLPLNAPANFYDVVVQVALIRPGPIVGKMAHPYMRRRQGKEEVTYEHPLLVPVLKRTLGVPLFQEQLLRMAMVVANFTGAEAEELRRAVGMRRSMQRMKDLEGRLRSGMAENNISKESQDNIVLAISSFAMYGFPESHAASFALIAYASAYLKVHYLAAFTCALLNNQPMGFYSPAVLVKDAQRHGLRVKPVDVQVSDTVCNLEHESDGSVSLRIGLNYVRGFKAATQAELIEARNTKLFESVDDLVNRVPSLSPSDLDTLAKIGALNRLQGIEHRRSALWVVKQAGRRVAPLLHQANGDQQSSPLIKMNDQERLTADFAGTGLTTGPHVMAYLREELIREGILASADLAKRPNDEYIWIAGCVIVRQRPGTAKGFVFLSVEDELGIANVILTPKIFDQHRMTINQHRFLKIAGRLQNVDGVVHLKGDRFVPMPLQEIQVRSHNYH